MVSLTARDRRILLLAYEQQFILPNHVLPLFPQTESGDREARRRVAELVRGQFLKRENSPVFGGTGILRLTYPGRKVAEEAAAKRLQQSRRISLAHQSHDAFVTSVRLRLERLWKGVFVCERAIKEAGYAVIPDGVFFLQGGKAVAIEVENSDKGRTRFLNLAERWKDVPSISAVLYVATHEPLLRTLQGYLAQCGVKRPSLGLISFNALMANEPKVWRPSGEADWFKTGGSA